MWGWLAIKMNPPLCLSKYRSAKAGALVTSAPNQVEVTSYDLVINDYFDRKFYLIVD